MRGPTNATTSTCAAPDPEATARFFETMFGAEAMRSVYPPGTLYPGPDSRDSDAAGPG